MADVVVETKLLVPRPRRQLVPRPRLVDVVRRASSLGPLTLVSAPAGFGKTTLLAAVANDPVDDEPRAVAWVSLDERDASARRFWSCVLRALETASPGCAATALQLLDSEGTALEDIVASMINELSVHPSDVTLVLDDYHLVDGPEVTAGLGFLLEHLPPQLHLIIGTRADPALPLPRMRARGQLVEVRASDLRFSVDEATLYLNDVQGLALTAHDVASLETRTEGWVAALQLAALSLHDRADPAAFIAGFAGDDRFVVDYLADEVLDQQPPQVRRFLLDTSVLERLTGPLCDAVTGQSGGHALLESLERRNLLIVPLDNRRRWYRYHHLFSDVLLSRLLHERPDDVASLHRRASEWFRGSGDLEAAVRHALAAGEVGWAADVIELASPALRRERKEAVIRGWIPDLPPSVVRQRPVLASAFIGALMSCNEFDGVAERMRDVDDALAGPKEQLVVLDQAEWARLPAVMATHRAGLALVAGDLDSTSRCARDALSCAGEDDLLSTAAASALLGLAAWTRGDLHEAHAAYARAAEGLGAAGHVADVLGCTVTLVELEIALGRLDDAHRTVTGALRLAEEHATTRPVRGSADMWVALSRVAWERGDVVATGDHLRRAADLGEVAGLPQQPYRWRVGMAQLRAAEGDLDGADMLLEEAERLYTGDFSPNVRPVAATRARLSVRAGDLTAARAWARAQGLSASDEPTYLREYEHMTLARILISEHGTTGDLHGLAEAVVLLDRLRDDAERGRRTAALVDVLVLRAIALEASGQRQEALRALERAAHLAEPEGRTRPFLDDGPSLERLLHALARRPGHPTFVRALHEATTTGRSRPSRASHPSGHPVEDLSGRERDVLRLLASDLDGPAIARRLNVSLATVRTHTQHIYTKLGVNNRRAAVRRGHVLDL
jgi:LuxR family maltose regulon positive regulatory protein